MPAELFGFVYDESKKKYFRIEANHQVAPASSKYSRQAVSAKRKHDHETRHEQKRSAVMARHRVSHAEYLNTPRGSFLRRQLGAKAAASTVVQQTYATDLHERNIFRGLQSDVFAVEPRSKQLFAVSTPRQGIGRQFCYSERSSISVGSDEDEDERTVYSRNFTVPIYEADRVVSCITPMDAELVVWTAHSDIGIGNHLPSGSRFYYSRRRRDWGWPGEEFGEWGTTESESDHVWDMKVQKDGGMKLAIAAQRGIIVHDVDNSHWGGRHVIRAPDHTDAWRAVEWKDSNILMAGTRSGYVCLADARAKKSVVARAKCQDAIRAVRSVGKSGDGMLVWTLGGGKLFDLRYNKDYRQGLHHGRGETVPYLTFDVKPSMMQKRHGLGFEYEEEMGVVAAAGYLHERHKIGMWDVKTGKLINDTAVSRKQYREPVTYLQMVDLEGRGGAKTLLAATDGKIQAWEV